MKTKNLFISGLIGLFASCSSQNCKIEGTVENAKDGDTLYLARMSDGNFAPTGHLREADDRDACQGHGLLQ